MSDMGAVDLANSLCVEANSGCFTCANTFPYTPNPFCYAHFGGGSLDESGIDRLRGCWLAYYNINHCADVCTRAYTHVWKCDGHSPKVFQYTLLHYTQSTARQCMLCMWHVGNKFKSMQLGYIWRMAAVQLLEIFFNAIKLCVFKLCVIRR